MFWLLRLERIKYYEIDVRHNITLCDFRLFRRSVLAAAVLVLVAAPGEFADASGQDAAGSGWTKCRIGRND